MLAHQSMIHTVTHSMTTISPVGISSCSLLPRFHIKKMKIHTWNKMIIRAIFNLKMQCNLNSCYQMCWLLIYAMLVALCESPLQFVSYTVKATNVHDIWCTIKVPTPTVLFVSPHTGSITPRWRTSTHHDTPLLFSPSDDTHQLSRKATFYF